MPQCAVVETHVVAAVVVGGGDGDGGGGFLPLVLLKEWGVSSDNSV